jgi:hypothetical protein
MSNISTNDTAVIRGDGGLYCRFIAACSEFRQHFGHWPTILKIDEDAWQVLSENHLGQRATACVRQRLRIDLQENALTVADADGSWYDYKTGEAGGTASAIVGEPVSVENWLCISVE